MIEIRVRDLTAYQDAEYAARYQALVSKVRGREQAIAPGSEALAIAVARNLYKLMAVKDEYEVARLYTDGEFAKRLNAQFDGNFRVAIHLAPPIPDPPQPRYRTSRKAHIRPLDAQSHEATRKG